MRSLLVVAFVAVFALGAGGLGCGSDGGSRECYPVYCLDGTEKRECDPPRCETEACPAGRTCVAAQSGEQVCIPDDICN